MSSWAKPLLITSLIFTELSCAYFNTFYNAQRYFRRAEENIVKAEDPEKLSKKTMEALAKTVAKCDAVLLRYPDSRWRDDALLLRGKARFYRGEYTRAKASLEMLVAEEIDSPLTLEGEIWLSRCKWKLGDEGTALEELGGILERLESGSVHGSRKEHLALCNEIVAQIYLAQGETDSAILYFDRSGQYLKTTDEKSGLYFRIAELAFNESRYNVAGDYYRKVIDLGGRPKQVETAHLQIVRITRIQEKWGETSEEIQNLLSNEKFTDIYPQLHLELAKLYQMQLKFREATNRYRVVTEEFPKTEASAEAYFQLGKITLETTDHYGEAKRYFESVEKEKRSSMFTPSARARVSEIDAFLSAAAAITQLEQLLNKGRSASEPPFEEALLAGTFDTVTDTLPLEGSAGAQAVDTLSILGSLADNLYAVGELLAFHFEKPDSGIAVFHRLVEVAPNSPKRSQALFSLFHLFQQRRDSTSAQEVAAQLLREYPLTEYAAKVSSLLGLEMHDEAEALLAEAEEKVARNPERAVELYKSILTHYPMSRYVPATLLAIGLTYDYQLNTLDSSLAFYERLMTEYPESEQALFVQPRYAQLLELRASLVDTLSAPDSLTAKTNEN